MQAKTKSLIQFVVLLGVGILLVWLAFRQVASEKDKIINAFASADYFWVFISAAIGFIAHFLRAYRWKYLLEPLGYKTSLINANAAVFIGYLANYGLPRMGELTRATVIDRYDKVPFQVGFGTVVTERIIDFLILIVIFVLTLVFQFTELAGLSNEYIFSPLKNKLHSFYEKPLLGSVILILVAGIFLALFLYRKKINEKLKGKFGSVIKGFLEGVSSVKKMKNVGAFIFLSLLIWAMYFYSLYVCMKALPETISIGHKECLTLMLFGTLGVALTPGGLGAYHIIITQILIFYGIAQIPAVALPWLVWTAQFILVLILGVLSLILLPVINKKKNVLQ